MLKEIASYWTGPKPLHYIHHISLASFVDKGHKVTLFTSPDKVNSLEVPKGVGLLSTDELMPGLSESLAKKSPVTASDLLRVLLVAQHGFTWVDTDMYCLRPFEDEAPYLFATEASEPIKTYKDGNINNAVISLPKESKALKLLENFALYSLGMVDEAKPDVQDYIDAKIGHAVLRYGPKALSYFLDHTGELKHQLAPHQLYPVHFNLIDCVFDPDVKVEERFKKDTLAIHFWASQIRAGWYRRRAWKGSFIWKAAKKHGINMQRHSYRK